MPSASIHPPALVRSQSSWSIAGAHYKHWATSLGNFGVTPFFWREFFWKHEWMIHVFGASLWQKRAKNSYPRPGRKQPVFTSLQICQTWTHGVHSGVFALVSCTFWNCSRPHSFEMMFSTRSCVAFCMEIQHTAWQCVLFWCHVLRANEISSMYLQCPGSPQWCEFTPEMHEVLRSLTFWCEMCREQTTFLSATQRRMCDFCDSVHQRCELLVWQQQSSCMHSHVCDLWIPARCKDDIWLSQLTSVVASKHKVEVQRDAGCKH